MAALGFLAIFQAILLPGLAALSCVKSLDRRTLCILSVPMSLMINQYLVMILALLGRHTRAPWLCICALEIAVILFASRRARAKQAPLQPLSWIEILALLFAFASIGKYVEAWSREFGTIFTVWDAIINWNQWGSEWFLYGHTIGAGLYPQGIPALYSIPYALLGSTEIQMFSKAISGLLFLTSLAAILDLGFRRPPMRVLCWLSVFIYPYVLAKFFQSHWNSGYADVPLADLVVFTFYALFAQPAIPPVLQGMIGGTAALVKQAGMMFAGLTCLLAPKLKLRTFLWTAAGSAIAAGPWYLPLCIRVFFTHTEQNNTLYLVNMVNRGFLGRWEFALELARSIASTAYLLSLAGLIILGTILNRKIRPWVLYFGLPYFFIWGTLFSYDIRNSAMVFFPFCLAIASCFVWPLEKLEKKFPGKKFPVKYVVVATTGFGLYISAITVLHLARFTTTSAIIARELREEHELLESHKQDSGQDYHSVQNILEKYGLSKGKY